MVTWEKTKLDCVLKVGHGKSQKEIETAGGEYPILATGGEIGRPDIFLYEKPSVLIGRTGTIVKPRYIDTPFWTIDTLFYTIINQTNNPKYLYYLFCTIDWASLNEASGVPSLSAKIIENLEVILPPLPEQLAIAAALSDVDCYIAALERLIAKKRNIRKGAMQELLTGKRRLPGFSGEWAEKRIGDITTIYGRIGFRGYTKEDIVEKGNGVISISPSNMIDGKMNFGNCTYITYEKYEESPEIKIFNGDVLLVKTGSTFGKTAYVSGLNEKATLNPQVVVFKDIKIDNRLLAYIVGDISFQNKINATIVGGAIPTLSQKQVSNYTILTPPTTEEQSAIAAILSDMDAEIDAMTAKLDKVRNIKQGMIQELLTGRIRLVNEETKENAVPEDKPAVKVIELTKRKPETAAAQTGGHNQQFDDAVMIAGIVNALYSDKYALGRKKVQKCLYLLRRHQDKSTSAFKKKAAGPYADEVRYKGGEPIALRCGYIRMQKGNEGTMFAMGPKVKNALDYITSWGKQADIQWLSDKLKFKSSDDLELLATVDMAICDLEEASIPVSVASIKHLIATNAEWNAKLKKQAFSDANIAKAIKELQTLL